MSMTRVEFQVPEGVLASLRCDPDRFGRELRLAAAVKWYERGMVSQGRAAEIAGVSRAEFLEALGRFGVTPFQVDAEELTAETSNE
jgi:predicted HTH domain antitoxin